MAKWYAVYIPVDEARQKSRPQDHLSKNGRRYIFEWAKEKSRGRVKSGLCERDIGNDDSMMFYFWKFKDPNDAVMFKIRWM